MVVSLSSHAESGPNESFGMTIGKTHSTLLDFFHLKYHDLLVLIFRSLLFVTPVLYRQVNLDYFATKFGIGNHLYSSDSSPRRTLTTNRQRFHIESGRGKKTLLRVTDLQVNLFCYFSSN